MASWDEGPYGMMAWDMGKKMWDVGLSDDGFVMGFRSI